MTSQLAWKVVVEKEGAARVTCHVKDKAYVPHSMVKAGFRKQTVVIPLTGLCIHHMYKTYIKSLQIHGASGLAGRIEHGARPG